MKIPFRHNRAMSGDALSRRRFLRLLGMGTIAGAALGAGAGEAAARVEGSFSGGPQGIHAKQWAMVIDTRKLQEPERLEAIVSACHRTHNVPAVPPPQDVKWIWPDSLNAAFTDDVDEFMPQGVQDRQFLLLCNHCANPACTRVCPTGATFRRDDGIVVMDYHRCVGCRYCMAACPYGSRSFNFQEPQGYLAETVPEYPPRTRGVVEKCNFCMERLAVGKMPLCVEASEGAIIFGDLSDPDSPVRAALAENVALRRKPALGTLPCVYYIL